MKLYIWDKNGFSIIEVIVSVLIFSMILLAVFSFFFSMNASYSKTKADREVQENARFVLEKITNEIKNAKGIYTPTTTASQISLETNNSVYLPIDETTTFLDFFKCGNSVCFRQEGQTNPTALTTTSVSVQTLTFSQFSNGGKPSVRIAIVVNYVNPTGSINSSSSISLTATSALRTY